jgi:hypothetical protein
MAKCPCGRVFFEAGLFGACAFPGPGFIGRVFSGRFFQGASFQAEQFLESKRPFSAHDRKKIGIRFFWGFPRRRSFFWASSKK